MYLALKYSHLLFIVLSVSLFILRFGLLMKKSKWFESRWIKVLPHVVDTLLIATGLGLIFITGFIPFTPSAVWMTEKLTCVLAYIALSYVALFYSQGTLFKLFAFFGALGWVYAAATLAISKTPQLLG